MDICDNDDGGSAVITVGNIANCVQERLRTADSDVSPAVSNGHHAVCSEASDDLAVQLGKKTICI